MADSTVPPRLAYSPSVEFNRLEYGNQCDLRSINPTLAVSTYRNSKELYLHANSLVTPWQGAENVSSRYRILRLRRQWLGNLNGSPPGPIADGYKLMTIGPRGFVEDHGDVNKSWNDCPGERIHLRPKTAYRALQEFVTGVGPRIGPEVPIPEFGGLYYIVAVDVTPTKYRLWMSLERRLTADQVQGAMGVPQKVYPQAAVRDGPPDFASWRYVPHEWIDYTKWLG
jgi:hypothetical protein